VFFCPALKETSMTRITAATLALAAAALAGNAFAESPTPDQPFTGSLSRAEVETVLKKPFVGGNPWSSSYNMFQAKSAVSTEQVRSAYKSSRDEVSALHGEDSGSAYLASMPLRIKSSTATMGAPAQDPSNIERDK
jgi:hypothetical protein